MDGRRSDRARKGSVEIRVGSFRELLEALYESSWMEPLGRFRSNLVFRGMSGASRGLETSLARLGDAPERVEGHLLRNFRKYARRDASHDDTVWNWLAIAQHHGLPTRLLDWTFSPLVAMHFATDELSLFDEDGVIWSVDFVKTNHLLPVAMQAALAAEGSNAFTVEMLSGVAPSLPELDRLAADPFVVFFEPPSIDQRIINQFALFAMMSSPSARLDRWLEGRPELHRKIIVPASLKWEVRDKLDQANVTERVLFPGLDGLSRWLKRYYTVKPRATSAPDAPSPPARGRPARKSLRRAAKKR